MDDLNKIIAKNIARTVCRLTRSTKPYRRIRSLLRRQKTEEEPAMNLKFPKISGNCHGFTLYGLNIDSSKFPRYIGPEVMEEFLEEVCFLGRMSNSVITAFRGGNKQLEHTGINILAGRDAFLLHHLDIGSYYELTTLEGFYERNPSFKTETFLEFYKIIPEKTFIPTSLLNY